MEDGGYAVPREAHGSWRRDGGYTCAQLLSPALILNPAEVDGQDEIDVERQQECGWRWVHYFSVVVRRCGEWRRWGSGVARMRGGIVGARV